MRSLGLSRLLRPASSMPTVMVLVPIVLAVVGAGVFAPLVAARAASSYPVPTVAVVDEGAVMNASVAVKSIKAQIDKIRTSYQQELTGKDQELHQMELALQSQGPTLAPDALAQRQKSLGEKAQEARATLQDHQGRLTNAFEQAMLQVQVAAKRVVDEIAVQNHISLVLPSTTVIDSLPSMDITPEVIARLNAQLTTVTVQVPK